MRPCLKRKGLSSTTTPTPDCQNGSPLGAGRVGLAGVTALASARRWLPVSVFILQSLTWSFGWNSSLPVYYMREDKRILLYVCGHTAIIYNVFKNSQYHLQVCRPCLPVSKA